MGAARRERSRKENSFLDLVRSELRDIKLEIASIKDILDTGGDTLLVSALAPPPAPPRLDVYDRNYLLQFRDRCRSRDDSGSRLTCKQLAQLESVCKFSATTLNSSAQIFVPGRPEHYEKNFDVQRLVGSDGWEELPVYIPNIGHPQAPVSVPSIRLSDKPSVKSSENRVTGEYTRLTSELKGDFRVLPKLCWQLIYRRFHDSESSATDKFTSISGDPKSTPASQVAVNRFEQLPSVGTWLHSVHQQPQDESPTQRWTEKETGEHVMALVSKLRVHASPLVGYQEFVRDVQYVKTKCPEPNIVWLDKLLEHWKAEVSKALRCGWTAGETAPVKSQEWFDKDRGRWWHEGVVICYFCGCADCEDVPSNCCERRRREVLHIDDEKPRPHKKRHKK